jgi:hypothetical protein
MAKAVTIYTGAYLARGGEAALDTLLGKLEKERVTERGSPDLFARSYRKFGVDEAEDLRSRVRTRPIAGTQRIFALFIPAITNEAQNALLKTLEEPAAGAAIFLITPSPETLLSTVRSRAQTLELSDSSAVASVDADDFLAASVATRLEMLKPLYEHDEDEGRDMGGVLAFLQALERKFAKGKVTPDRAEGLRAVYRARKYAGDRGSLLKSLLEQVALLAPKV